MSTRKGDICRASSKSFYYSQDSPRLTPSTHYSASFSSEDCVSLPTEGREIKQKTHSIRNFQEQYLDVGLWPGLSEADLRLKYRQEKEKRKELEREKRQLKAELERPCENCRKERESHRVTKEALDRAVALSSFLLQQVVRMDGRERGSDGVTNH